MKRMKTGILTFGLFMVSPLGSELLTQAYAQTIETTQTASFAEKSTLEAFMYLEEEWLNAVQFESKLALQSRLEGLIANDFVYQHGSGQNLTKAVYIDLLVKGDITVADRGPLDLSVRDYGDTVITYGSSSMTGRVFGAPYDGDLRFINVWRQQPDGQWILTHRNSELL
ncbi:MAG: nuclear transport factor 2 family protein [Cyanobacteria bacterium P01_G01_bin.38]